MPYHLAETVYEECKTQPCTLAGIRFDNVFKTKKSALLKETTELYSCKTLDELVQKAHMASQHMEDVGLLERCHAVVEKSHGGNDDFILRFVVKEPKAVTVGVKMGVTSSGTADGSLTASKGSIWGSGESANISYSKALRGGHNFSLSFLKPWLGWQKYTNSGIGLRRGSENLSWNECNLTENAVVLQHGSTLFNQRLAHLLKLNMVWRSLLPSNKSAFAVREHAGHTTKFSLENVLSVDNRDRPILPERGGIVKLTTELAAFVGDSSFLRHELFLQAAAKLPLGAFVSGSMQLQAVQNIGSRTLHVLDRVYLGGPQDVRGFKINTIGPKMDNSSLGGAAAIGLGAHLFYPLYPKDVFFAHAFASAGTVASVRSREWLADMSETMRCSIGLGITAILRNLIRFELSYVLPVAHVPGDQCEPGFYFGAGTNFL